MVNAKSKNLLLGEKMKEYNKLVRDKIDEIINNNGKGEKAVVKILNDEEYKNELLKKLEEEKAELINAVACGNKNEIVEESADLLEVVRAINGGDLTEVLSKMEDKKQKRGGFDQKKFLVGVVDKK